MATNPGSGHLCTEIVGLDNIALSFDGGQTLVRSRASYGREAWDVVSLGSPYTLLANGSGISISVDGGCHWTHVREANLGHHTLTTGHDGVAYAWNWRSGDAMAVTIAGLRTRKPLPCRVGHLEADAANPSHLRAVAACGFFSSDDGGESWTQIGGPSSQGMGGFPAVAYAPGDMDHMLYLGNDVYRGRLEMSRDGGRSWVRAPVIAPLQVGPRDMNDYGSAFDSTGRPSLILLSATPGSLVFARDGATAWFFHYRDIYRSTDGGASFRRVLALDEQQWSGLKVIGLQGDEYVLLAERTMQRQSFLIRFNARTLEWSKQPLPLDAGYEHDADGHSAYTRRMRNKEIAAGGVLVPGETSAICMVIERDDVPIPPQ